jgi:hypothetical protein
MLNGARADGGERTVLGEKHQKISDISVERAWAVGHDDRSHRQL